MNSRTPPPSLDSAALLDALTDAVVIADSAGVIVYVNPAADRLLGAAAGDLVGGPLVEIIPERLRSAHLAGWERYTQKREARLIGSGTVRLPALRRDGTEIDIDLALSAHITSAGEEVIIGTLRDLGDRIELERQRRITTYLAASQAIMTRLAVGAGAATLTDVAPMLLETLAEGLGWDGGTVWTHDRGVLTPVAWWPEGPGSVARTMSEGVVLQAGEGLPGRVAQGAASWIETVSTDGIFVRRDRAEQAGVRSCFAFPIAVGGEALGVVEMYSQARQAPEPELLALLETAGREIGRYLERTEARRHLVELAETLQASLLPPQSPTVPGLDVAVRYRAAGGEGQIGGDFFDVFPLPDGEWAILIGDVSGRGPRAAALTALARYTLRAAAIGAASPSAVLAVLNDVVRRELETAFQGDERFVTVAYLTLAPSASGFSIVAACGGHPQPLARRADGSVEPVPCEGDLIGAFNVHEALDQSIELQAEDLLVLVTDGVIEARGEGGEFGEDRLRQVIAAAGSTAADVADAVDAAVVSHLEGHPQDDLAIVVIRLPASPLVTTSVEVHIPESDRTR
ncbi:MAG TPA: SpoIIE family protein phosphatase [Acidimicrobiia bacterium]|nr:SpoIIE family protein phosphatase [Acidimicrobiia bacterium]